MNIKTRIRVEEYSDGSKYHYPEYFAKGFTVFGIDITKGKPVYNKQGELIEYWEYLPLINGVYGGKDDVAMLTTSYN